MEKTSVVITGASGLLGRAVMKKFADQPWKKVLGTAFSRSGDNLVKVDLTNVSGISSFIEETRPNFLVHSAAQRFPDKMAQDPEGARKLNVEATRALASSMKKAGGRLIYISTDYVFDGKNPPYTIDSPTNPLQDYGQSKLDGEKVVLQEDPENIVLRIPILYGDVQYLDESAITTLFKKLLDESKTPVEMSDYEIRRPANVNDIAAIINDLVKQSVDDEKSPPKGIYQWSGEEPMTKFDMVGTMAKVFGLDASHVKPLKGPSPGAPRPYDTTMDTSRLTDRGIRHHTPFSDGIKEALSKWKN